MALQAFLNAKNAAPGERAFGLGCTAAIATARDRKGDDRCHIAIQSESRTRTAELILDKSLNREAQERLCQEAIIGLMSEESGINVTHALEFSSDAHDAEDDWKDLIMDRANRCSPTDEFGAIFPGAFNPLHDGHRAILAMSAELLTCPVALEISIKNVDKPSLDYLTMRERLDQARPLPLVFTNAPTFEEKSVVFPGVTFIVGIDTLVRIQDPNYYDSVRARDNAITSIKDRNNRFLVFGRKINHKFQTLDDINLLPELRSICAGVHESDFRLDISSSKLRTDRSV